MKYAINTYTLDDDVLERLKGLSLKTGIPEGKLVDICITYYLDYLESTGRSPDEAIDVSIIKGVTLFAHGINGDPGAAGPHAPWLP